MKFEINDILGLKEPTTKLIDMISGVIGTVYEPRKIKKLADAEAYRIKKITSTAQETNFNGEIEFLDGKIKINCDNINNIEIKSLIENELKRLLSEKENIMTIADIAYDELEDCKDNISLDLDEDWKNNFFECSKKIYNPDLHYIFGKILAGEIKNPGTYSKRLINILVNLSQKEAVLFKNIANYVFRDSRTSFIISDSTILNNYNINIEDIVELEEIGLLNSVGLTVSDEKSYEYMNCIIDFYGEKPTFNVFALTTVGREIEKIINQENKIDINYIKDIQKLYNIKKIKCLNKLTNKLEIFEIQ